MNAKISTRTTEVFLDDAGIIRIRIFEGVTIDLDDAVDNFLVVKQLSGNRSRLKLVDARVKWKITKEARAYIVKEDVPGRTIARGILIQSMTNRLVTNFLLKLNRPLSPLKVFLSEEKAIVWLNSFR